MKTIFLKTTAFITAVFFSATTLYGAQPVSVSLNPAEYTPAKIEVPEKFSFPRELGTLQEFSRSTESDRFVIYIQDAHAVIDAQKNMEALISYFQNRFNIRLVAVEGTKDDLDPVIFKTFPDEFIKKKVLNQYAAKGEISGPELAAIFSPHPATYFGIEDWGIYEQNYRAYLQASDLREKVQARLDGITQKMDAERQGIYSPEFNGFHEQVTLFRNEKLDLFQLLKYLSSIDKKGSLTEERFPHLFPVFKAANSEDPSASEDMDAVLRKMADHLKKKILVNAVPNDIKEFNEKYQNFVTAQIDAGSFLKFLVESGRKVGVSPKLSPSMRELLGQTETLGMIKGTKLFEELETVLAGFENNFASSPEQKELSARYARLRILTDLNNLEWTRDQLDEYKKTSELYSEMLGDGASDIEPALEFYKLAMERDQIFLDRIEEEMNKEKVQGVIVLTGGFHTAGFEERLKHKKYSYAVIMPKMTSLQGHENYAPVMKGEISYKRFLKTTLYDAFVKDSTLKMVGEMSEPTFRKNIKIWRDAVIRELSRQGRIEESGKYTKYIDDLFSFYAGRYGLKGKFQSREEILKGVDGEVEKLNKETLDDFAAKFQMKSRQFFEGFKTLASDGKLNVDQIKGLYLKVAAGQPSAVSNARPLSPNFTASGFQVTARSETRAVNDAQISGLQNLMGEAIVELRRIESENSDSITGDPQLATRARYYLNSLAATPRVTYSNYSRVLTIMQRAVAFLQELEAVSVSTLPGAISVMIEGRSGTNTAVVSVWNMLAGENTVGFNRSLSGNEVELGRALMRAVVDAVENNNEETLRLALGSFEILVSRYPQFKAGFVSEEYEETFNGLLALVNSIETSPAARNFLITMAGSGVFTNRFQLLRLRLFDMATRTLKSQEGRDAANTILRLVNARANDFRGRRSEARAVSAKVIEKPTLTQANKSLVELLILMSDLEQQIGTSTSLSGPRAVIEEFLNMFLQDANTRSSLDISDFQKRNPERLKLQSLFRKNRADLFIGIRPRLMQALRAIRDEGLRKVDEKLLDVKVWDQIFSQVPAAREHYAKTQRKVSVPKPVLTPTKPTKAPAKKAAQPAAPIADLSKSNAVLLTNLQNLFALNVQMTGVIEKLKTDGKTLFAKTIEDQRVIIEVFLQSLIGTATLKSLRNPSDARLFSLQGLAYQGRLENLNRENYDKALAAILVLFRFATRDVNAEFSLTTFKSRDTDEYLGNVIGRYLEAFKKLGDTPQFFEDVAKAPEVAEREKAELSLLETPSASADGTLLEEPEFKSSGDLDLDALDKLIREGETDLEVEKRRIEALKKVYLQIKELAPDYKLPGMKSKDGRTTMSFAKYVELIKKDPDKLRKVEASLVAVRARYEQAQERAAEEERLNELERQREEQRQERLKRQREQEAREAAAEAERREEIESRRYNEGKYNDQDYLGVSGRDLSKVGALYYGFTDADEKEAAVGKIADAELKELSESLEMGKWWGGISAAIAVIVAFSYIWFYATAVGAITLATFGVPIILTIGAVPLIISLGLLTFSLRKGRSRYTFSEWLVTKLPFMGTIENPSFLARWIPMIAARHSSAKETAFSRFNLGLSQVKAPEDEMEELEMREARQQRIARAVLRNTKILLNTFEGKFLLEAVRIVFPVSLTVLIASGLLLPFFSVAALPFFLYALMFSALFVAISILVAAFSLQGLDFVHWLYYSYTGTITEKLMDRAMEKRPAKRSAVARGSDDELRKIIVIIMNGLPRFPKLDKDGFADPKSVKKILSEASGISDIETISLTNFSAKVTSRSEARLQMAETAARSEARAVVLDNFSRGLLEKTNASLLKTLKDLVAIEKRLQSIKSELVGSDGKRKVKNENQKYLKAINDQLLILEAFLNPLVPLSLRGTTAKIDTIFANEVDFTFQAFTGESALRVLGPRSLEFLIKSLEDFERNIERSNPKMFRLEDGVSFTGSVGRSIKSSADDFEASRDAVVKAVEAQRLVETPLAADDLAETPSEDLLPEKTGDVDLDALNDLLYENDDSIQKQLLREMRGFYLKIKALSPKYKIPVLTNPDKTRSSSFADYIKANKTSARRINMIRNQLDGKLRELEQKKAEDDYQAQLRQQEKEQQEAQRRREERERKRKLEEQRLEAEIRAEKTADDEARLEQKESRQYTESTYGDIDTIGVTGRNLAKFGARYYPVEDAESVEASLASLTDNEIKRSADDMSISTLWGITTAIMVFTLIAIYSAAFFGATTLTLGAFAIPFIITAGAIPLWFSLGYGLFELTKSKAGAPYSFAEWLVSIAPFFGTTANPSFLGRWLPFVSAVRESAKEKTLARIGDESLRAVRSLRDLEKREVIQERIGRMLLRNTKSLLDSYDKNMFLSFAKGSAAVGAAVSVISIVLSLFFGFTPFLFMLFISGFVVAVLAVVASAVLLDKGVSALHWLYYVYTGRITETLVGSSFRKTDDVTSLFGGADEELKKVTMIMVGGKPKFLPIKKDGYADPKEVRKIMRAASAAKQKMEVVMLTNLNVTRTARSEARTQGQIALPLETGETAPAETAARSEVRGTAAGGVRDQITGQRADMPRINMDIVNDAVRRREAAQPQSVAPQAAALPVQTTAVSGDSSRLQLYGQNLVNKVYADAISADRRLPVSRNGVPVTVAAPTQIRDLELALTSLEALGKLADYAYAGKAAGQPNEVAQFQTESVRRVSTLVFDLSNPGNSISNDMAASKKVADKLYDLASLLMLDAKGSRVNGLKPLKAGVPEPIKRLALDTLRQAIGIYERIQSRSPEYLKGTDVLAQAQRYAAAYGRSEVRPDIAALPVVISADSASLEALAPVTALAEQVLSQFSGQADLEQISLVINTISADRREAVVKPAQEQMRRGISEYLSKVKGEGLDVATAILSPKFEAEITRLSEIFAETIFTDAQVRASFAESLKVKFTEQIQRFVINSVILGYEIQQAQAAQNIRADTEANKGFVAANQEALEQAYQSLLAKNNGKLVIDDIEMPATLFAAATPDSTTSYVFDSSFGLNKEFLTTLLETEHPVALAYPVGTDAEKQAMAFAKELSGLMRMIFGTLGARNDQPVDLNRLSKYNFAPESRQALVGSRLAIKSAGIQGDVVVQTQESFVPVVGEADFLPLMVKFLSTNLVKQLPEVNRDGSKISVLDEKHFSAFLNLVKKLMTEFQSAQATARAA